MTPTCGICGGHIGRTMTPHGAICEDDRKAESVAYSPEIDDLIRSEEESARNGR